MPESLQYSETEIETLLKQQDVLLNEQTIFNYMIDLLINEGGDGQQYIRFDERKHKEAFIKYIILFLFLVKKV